MPRTKGSKNRPKTNTDYASQIAEKQAKADAKAAEEAKKTKAETVLKKLLAHGIF